eukprot:UN09219
MHMDDEDETETDSVSSTESDTDSSSNESDDDSESDSDDTDSSTQSSDSVKDGDNALETQLTVGGMHIDDMVVNMVMLIQNTPVEDVPIASVDVPATQTKTV